MPVEFDVESELARILGIEDLEEGNRVISFGEFLRLVTRRPWSVCLVQDARCVIDEEMRSNESTL